MLKSPNQKLKAERRWRTQGVRDSGTQGRWDLGTKGRWENASQTEGNSTRDDGDGFAQFPRLFLDDGQVPAIEMVFVVIT